MAGRSRVVVIGVGSIGERHARCFLETGRAGVEICEQNIDVRERVAARYGLSDSYSDFEAVLADAPDVAVICTPAHLHVPLATRLAEAGVHVLIEKPLSTGLDGVDRLQAAVRDNDVVAGVAYVQRLNPVFQAMRQEILSGRFGEPVQLVYVGGQNFPYYRPAYRDIYYADRNTGGGAVQDALTHVVDLGMLLAGPITRLAADVEHKVLDGVEVEDTVHVIARQGNVLASYCLNQHQAPNEITTTVIGTRGTARFEMHRNRWRWQTEPGDEWHDESFPPVERDSTFVEQANRFLDAVAGRSTVGCTLEEGIRNVKVSQAILTAAHTRTWQSVD